MDMATRDTDMGGYIWMGDMIMPSDSSEFQMDTNFFTEAHLEDMRNRQPTMEGYMMLEELDEGMYYDDVNTMTKISPATNQTKISTNVNSRKIKPVKHPGLKLKTPIAYQKDTDPNVIPIQKDGMAVCENCGAMGVKHAFYTRERRFCSLACVRGSSANWENKQNPNISKSEFQPSFDNTAIVSPMQQQLPSEMPTTMDQIFPVANLNVQIDESQQQLPFKFGEDDTSQDSTQLYHVPPIPPLSPEEPMFPIDRKFSPELAASYDWLAHLNDPEFWAAPVYNFSHAPMFDCWDNITVGMKVEVENTDCESFADHFPDSFWVASVQKIAGYKALLRYEGFGDNSSKDFWINLCSSSVHPVGWCATRGKPLIPPRTIENKFNDWKDFLVKRLTGARTLPSNFYHKVQESMKSRFRCDLNLEVVDKKRISQVKVATIEKIVGKRLQVRYHDDDDNFWCNEDSPLIHPVGWARRVGHLIDAPEGYQDRCIKGIRDRDDATEDLFPLATPYNKTFAVGMKLETVDPLNLSDICVATVMQVLNDKFMMIRVNSYDDDTSGIDWFCYHMTSPYIFAPGFCAKHGISLTPPKGYDQSTFTWDQYCLDTNSIPAPPELFNTTIPDHGFCEGMRLEAADLMNPNLICVGTICRIVGRLLRVHFDGWEDEFDQWIDCVSCDIYPVGWCEIVSHKLEPPKSPAKPGQPKPLFRGGKRRRKNRYQKKPLSQKLDLSSASTMSSPNSVDHLSTSSFPSPSNLGEVAPFRTSTWDEPSFADQVSTASSNSNSEKEIPCLKASEENNSFKPEDVVPVNWGVDDVCNFLRKNECTAYCDNFIKKQINGKKLLTLSKEECFELTGNKAGPSIKIAHLISLLNKYSQNPDRFKSALQKPLL